jgi:hypothetical protein
MARFELADDAIQPVHAYLDPLPDRDSNPNSQLQRLLSCH